MKNHAETDIAIIGMACRYPGNTNTPQEFWNFILNKGDGIVDIPADRWESDAYYDVDKNKHNKMYIKQGGFLENIDQFDPLFFNISPKEAPHIDPQHRWLLELTQEVLENSGLKASELKGSDTAVYIGQFMHDYEQVQLDSMAHNMMSSHSATGPSMTLTSNRISYAFDFTGPSVTLDTACSSSLVALDLACKAILNGDSKVAVAGGVNILLRPELTMAICKASMLSPDARCKSFDSSANGYVRSEGAGLVIVKKLSEALKDGDNIQAVIKASGTNQDGQTIGITVPNGAAQKRLLDKTLAKANFSRSDIQYAEAHGTGTPVGDPIEVNALGALFGERKDEQEKCIVGSVKSNIGHTEAAAGVAGLIKTVMAMNTGTIPKNLHLENINPAINLDELNIKLADIDRAWPDVNGHTRKAIVNSFGFGGTNSNVVLEQAPFKEEGENDQTSIFNRDLNILPISSKTKKGLMDQAKCFHAYLSNSKDIDLHDICYTASVKRDHYQHRLVLNGATKSELNNALKAFIEGEVSSSYISNSIKNKCDQNLCFVFSGMGTTWAGMGKYLYQKEPVFKKMMDKCDKALALYTGWSLVDVILNEDDKYIIHNTDKAQPAIFASQVSLVSLLKSWGVSPSCIVGHSAGEVAAAYVAGVLNFDDAIKVIYHRSQLQHTTEGMGKMLAVSLTQSQLQPYLEGVEDKISLAAINSEQALTLSGDEQVLTNISNELDQKGIFSRFLKVEVPYHSPVMDQLKEPLTESLAGIKVNTATIPLFSTVSGELTQEGNWGAKYWPENVREPVLFKRAIDNIIKKGYSSFLEIAPHTALSSSISSNVENINQSIVVGTLKRAQNDVLMMSQMLSSLFCHGIELKWNSFYPNGGKLVSLPNYAWQHERYWHESEEVEACRLKNISKRGGFSEIRHPLVGGQLNSFTKVWQNQLDLQNLEYLEDHQVGDEIVYPGAAYVEMGLFLANHLNPEQTITLENVDFKRAFYLEQNNPPLIETSLDNNHYQISAQAPSSESWEVFSEGSISEIGKSKPISKMELSKLRGELNHHMDKGEFYTHCHKLGLTYQYSFQMVEQAWFSHDKSLVEIELEDSILSQNEHYFLHPSILDGAFQSLFPTIASSYLPVKIRELHYYQKPDQRCYCYLETKFKDANEIHGDLVIFDGSGNILVEIFGVELKANSQQSEIEKTDFLYDFEWNNEALIDQIDEPKMGQWLIFADNKGYSRQLEKELKIRNQKLIVFTIGNSFKKESDEHYIVKINEVKKLVNLFQQFSSTANGVIYLSALDCEPCNLLAVDDLYDSHELTTLAPMYLVQALNKVQWEKNQKVFLTTRTAHNLFVQPSTPQPIQNSMWGFGRVVSNEHPEYNLTLLDLPETMDGNWVQMLSDELFSSQYEQEVAFRSNVRYVNRLKKISKNHLIEFTNIQKQLPENKDFRINVNNQLEILKLSELAKDEVEIKLDIASLHNIIGFDGVECSGTITKTGDGIKDFEVGDKVMGIIEGSPASRVHVCPSLLIKKPDSISFSEAATIPTAYITAYYSLIQLANLQQGEKVLIHQANDSFGIAAIEIAQLKGATIVATASTAEQRNYLKSLGVQKVYNSTDFEFSSHLKKENIKVDVVLNRLGGQFIDKSIDVMNSFARFIELSIDSKPFKNTLKNSISYHNISLSDLIFVRPKLCKDILFKVTELLSIGKLLPLPARELSVNEIKHAAELYNKADNDLKTLIDFNMEDISVIQGVDEVIVNESSSYLVTGGLGGLGLEIMHWLSRSGARSIVLTGRSNPSSNALKEIEKVRSSGTDVIVMQADVTDSIQVTNIIHEISDRLLPLAGVIHSAGVLEDGTVDQQTTDKFNKVLSPKIKGSWLLHQATDHIDLDFFVCFSSIASIVGWAGQSNYAAANSFMDGLAHYRHSLGKPALSINWGPWSGSGMAANLADEDIQRMNNAGMSAISPENGLSAMTTLLHYRVPQSGVFDLDWSLIIKQYAEPEKKTLFKNFVALSDAVNENNFIDELLVSHEKTHKNLLARKISEVFSEVLGLSDVDGIDHDRNIFEYGLDSLMSMDFKNRMQTILKVKLPASLVMKHPTINLMVTHILDSVLQTAISGDALLESDIVMWSPETNVVSNDHQVNGPLKFATTTANMIAQGQSSHFNMGGLLSVGADKFDIETLKTTMKILLSFHDGARIRIFKRAEQYEQEILPLDKDFVIEQHDFSHLDYSQGVQLMQKEINALQHGFEFSKECPLFKVAHFKLNDQDPHRIFLIFHHFITDGVSLNLLMKDFGETYVKVFNSETVIFPAKSYSLHDWTNRLDEFAHSGAQEQIDYWLKQVDKSKQCQLPNDFHLDRPRLPQDLSSVEFKLDERTYQGLTNVCKELQIEVIDVAIQGLIKAMSSVTLDSSLWLDLVFHGRNKIFDEVDISELFGQVTEYSSILFEANENNTFEQQLKGISEHRQKAPNSAIGLKALRYLNSNEELSHVIPKLISPKILLNFDLNDYSSQRLPDWFAVASENFGEMATLIVEQEHSYELHMKGVLKDNGLSITLSYWKDTRDLQTVKAIKEQWLEHIHNIVLENQNQLVI